VTVIPRTTRPKPRPKAPVAKKPAAKKTAAKKPVAKKKASPAQALLSLAASILDDGKAEDLVTIDLKGKSDIADYLLIATGRSNRQVVALAQRLLDGFKTAGYGKLSAEGVRHGEWVLIDAGDVVIHLFRPETRTHYNLEKMWGETLAEAIGQA
jgi:ribosome-associated protein